MHCKSSKALIPAIRQHNLTALVVLCLRPSDLALVLDCPVDDAMSLQMELLNIGGGDGEVETNPTRMVPRVPDPGVAYPLPNPHGNPGNIAPSASMDSLNALENEINNVDLLPPGCIPARETLDVVEMLRALLRRIEDTTSALDAGKEPAEPVISESMLMQSTNALMARELIEKTERLLAAERTISGLLQMDVQQQSARAVSYKSTGGGSTTISDASTKHLFDDLVMDEINLDVPYVPAKSLSACKGLPVILNVYSISDSVALPLIGLGMYHTGIAVYGKEFAFAGRHGHEGPDGTGVYWTQPMRALPNLVASHIVGSTRKSPSQVWQIVNALTVSWRRSTYHIFSRNCNHFTSTLASAIVENPPDIPSYINRAAMLGGIFVPDKKSKGGLPAIEGPPMGGTPGGR